MESNMYRTIFNDFRFRHTEIFFEIHTHICHRYMLMYHLIMFSYDEHPKIKFQIICLTTLLHTNKYKSVKCLIFEIKTDFLKKEVSIHTKLCISHFQKSK